MSNAHFFTSHTQWFYMFLTKGEHEESELLVKCFPVWYNTMSE